MGTFANLASGADARAAFNADLATIAANGESGASIRAKLIGAGVASFAAGDALGSVRTKINNWLSVSAAAFTMTQLAKADRIYQRSTLTGGGQNKGQGTIPVALSAVTTSGKIYARCSSGGATRGDLQAAWRAATVASTGAQTVNITGVDARLGWFYLDLSGDGVTWQNGTVLIGMGALVAMSGQSLMVRMFTKYVDTTTLSGAGVSAPANGRLFVSSDATNSTIATAWRSVSDTTTGTDGEPLNGAGAAELMTRLIAIAGVNVGLVSKVVGQTEIADWQAGTTYGDALTATMDAAGGKFEAIIWYQGHSDSGNAKSTVYYKGKLDSLFANLAAHNSFSSPAIVIASIPNINSTNWGGISNKEAIRRAAYEWATANGAIPVQMNDISMVSDGIHADQAGSVRQGRHFYRALRPHFGASNDDRTTTLGTPTHASGSTDIVIPFTAGRTLSSVGSPATRFKVYQRIRRDAALALDGTTPITINNTAKTITLKLASDPGQVPLDILPFGANDPANDGTASMIYDDVTDSDGISQGRQLHPGGQALHVNVNHDLTIGGGASYVAGKFGNTLSGAAGYTATPVLPSFAEGYRVEFWVKAGSTTGLKGIVGGAGLWIAIDGNTLMVRVVNGSADYSSALPTGTWVHVAVTMDGNNTVQTHINGVAQSTYTVDYPDGGFVGVFGVRGLGFAPGSYDMASDQLVDEVAIWRGQWPSTVVPSSAYTGSEPGLLALWHLNGNGANSAA